MEDLLPTPRPWGCTQKASVPGKYRSVYVDLSLQCHTRDWDHSSLNEGMDTVSGIPSDTVPITEGMQNLPLDVKAISRQSVNGKAFLKPSYTRS